MTSSTVVSDQISRFTSEYPLFIPLLLIGGILFVLIPTILQVLKDRKEGYKEEPGVLH